MTINGPAPMILAMFMNTAVDQLIEKHLRAVSGQAPEPELLSRAVQRTVGLVTGIVVFGCALGGIFALVFVCAYGRIGSLSPRATAAVLAAAAVVVEEQ